MEDVSLHCPRSVRVSVIVIAIESVDGESARPVQTAGLTTAAAFFVPRFFGVGVTRTNSVS